MAYLALLEDLENRALRRERVFKEHADLLSESTEWLLSRYRFPKNILMELCQDFQPMFERETQRTKATPVHIQLLSTLGFLATGTFQREIGDICGILQPTLSRIMPAVFSFLWPQFTFSSRTDITNNPTFNKDFTPSLDSQI